MYAQDLVEMGMLILGFICLQIVLPREMFMCIACCETDKAVDIKLRKRSLIFLLLLRNLKALLPLFNMQLLHVLPNWQHFPLEYLHNPIYDHIAQATPFLTTGHCSPAIQPKPKPLIKLNPICYVLSARKLLHTIRYYYRWPATGPWPALSRHAEKHLEKSQSAAGGATKASYSLQILTRYLKRRGFSAGRMMWLNYYLQWSLRIFSGAFRLYRPPPRSRD